MLDGGKSELSDMLGVRLDHLSKMLKGSKGITDQKFARMEEIASKVLPPGFGYQKHKVTDLSEIWSQETILLAEMAAKKKGVTLEEYVKSVAREDLRPVFEGTEGQTQPASELEPLAGKENNNQSQ